MQYEVKLTEQAYGQIEKTVQYISKTLLAPETARKWTDTLQREIENLKATPHNSVRGIAPRFYVTKRRKNAGILGVFQVFKTHLWRKRSSECRRRNCAVLPELYAVKIPAYRGRTVAHAGDPQNVCHEFSRLLFC